MDVGPLDFKITVPASRAIDGPSSWSSLPEGSKFISIEATCESIEASTSRLHESEHSTVFGKYARASDILAEDKEQQRQEEDLNAMSAQAFEDSEESDEVSDGKLQARAQAGSQVGSQERSRTRSQTHSQACQPAGPQAQAGPRGEESDMNSWKQKENACPLADECRSIPDFRLAGHCSLVAKKPTGGDLWKFESRLAIEK